jgi:hypothetical protein
MWSESLIRPSATNFFKVFENIFDMIKRQDVLILPHKYKSKAAKMFSTNFAITSKEALSRLFFSFRVVFFTLLGFYSMDASAQRCTSVKLLPHTELSSFPARFPVVAPARYIFFSSLPSLKRPQSALGSILTLPRFTPDQLPVFCKIEHKLGKKMAVPLKFRLGSVEYVDWLEGKPGHLGY